MNTPLASPNLREAAPLSRSSVSAYPTESPTPFPPNRERYYLAPFVFCCPTPKGAVLLHLKRNRYFGLSRSDVSSLNYIVDNWPRDLRQGKTAAVVGLPSTEGSRSFLTSLMELEILQTVCPMPYDIVSAPVSLDGPLVSIGDEIVVQVSIRFTDLFSLIRSLLFTSFCLRFLSMESTARKVSARRLRAISRGYTFKVERVAQLVCLFRRMRPYFFTANGRCLFHALALVNFLAAHDEYPCWVLGVMAEPWGAHSWAQEGEYLLDTNPEKVCSYQPILAI